MTYQNIRLDIDGAVAQVVLCRPEQYNALSVQALQELGHAFEALEGMPVVRAVLIRAEGKAFCAGGDVKEMVEGLDRSEEQIYGVMQHYNKVARGIIGLSKPVVVAVNGLAVGAGANIAFASDVIFADEKAKFSQIFTNIGLIPDTGATWLMPRLVGRARAMEAMLTHRMIPAAEAQQMGLVSRVLPPEELQEAAMAMVKELAAGPTTAYANLKRLVNRSFTSTLEEMLEAEAKAQTATCLTQDYREGVQALVQKRPANFTGK